MTVAEMNSKMSSMEKTEWKAFFKLEPWGRQAEDTGSAIVAATLANINRQKGCRPFSPLDFTMDWSGELAVLRSPKQSTETMKTLLKGLHKEQQRKLGRNKGKKRKRKKDKGK